MRRPEEARRPGSMSEDPYPVTAYQGERRRGNKHAECLLCRPQGLNPLGCHRSVAFVMNVSQGGALLADSLFNAAPVCLYPLTLVSSLN